MIEAVKEGHLEYRHRRFTGTHKGWVEPYERGEQHRGKLRVTRYGGEIFYGAAAGPSSRWAVSGGIY
jgi:hypothetical protein